MSRISYTIAALLWSAVPWLIFLVMCPAFADTQKAIEQVAIIWMVCSPLVTLCLFHLFWPATKSYTKGPK
jgi:uncharacterized membrane protein (GlpM family)